MLADCPAVLHVRAGAVREHTPTFEAQVDIVIRAALHGGVDFLPGHGVEGDGTRAEVIPAAVADGGGNLRREGGGKWHADILAGEPAESARGSHGLVAANVVKVLHRPIFQCQSWYPSEVTPVAGDKGQVVGQGNGGDL